MSYELHCYNDNNIELEYVSYISNEPNVILELYRGKLFCYIIKEFIYKATTLFGTKIFSIKKSCARTLTNLLSSWMFNLYASKEFNNNKDPFLPNNFNETLSLKNILLDLIKYDTTILNAYDLIDELINFLTKLFETQLKMLDSYKKSSYYNTNKNNYIIKKNKIIQERLDKNYDFYKFEVQTTFDIKDKRLGNILDNLLIPFDEYNKLKINYSGQNCMDEYIWIILFRYQLLGSNNHQLGVKSDIMSNMNKDYNLNFECFASSINSTFKRYCSIYYDVEKYFGSTGSFYNLTPKRGTFGLNPPYQKDIIETALLKALEYLEESANNNRDLTFIITIPIWDTEGRKEFTNDLPQQNIDYGDFDIIKKVTDSKYHKLTRKIAKENFTYIDHNFKLLKNKTIQNTYVIIISSKKDIDTSKLLQYDFR